MATLRNRWEDFSELLAQLVSHVECCAVNGKPPDCQGIINDMHAVRDAFLKDADDYLDTIAGDNPWRR